MSGKYRTIVADPSCNENGDLETPSWVAYAEWAIGEWSDRRYADFLEGSGAIVNNPTMRGIVDRLRGVDV